MKTVRVQRSTVEGGDNLDRLLGLLEAARIAEAARKRVTQRDAWRALLAAIEHEEPAGLAA